ncbi:hypothetical protein ARMSODRAFT_46097 [Armillaria solidipes]|uniref:Uncharacterized protein n=1 Tax=Armillaria solidipes TaxID=1076256 RepID=A0A2H3CJJ6_9AGAR|nr:hypothetical protein ARMSODRAFT_46097 [Armillaria solidipes]
MGLSMSSRKPETLSSSIDLLTDDQVKALIDAAVSRNDTVGIRHNPGISWMHATAWKIAPDAVVKRCDPHVEGWRGSLPPPDLILDSTSIERLFFIRIVESGLRDYTNERSSMEPKGHE